MINSNEILDKLRNGESIEKIGNDIAVVLNLANDQYQEELKEKEDNARRFEELRSIFDSFGKWYNTYYKEILSTEDLDTVTQAIIDTIETLNSLDDFLSAYSNKLDNKVQKFTNKSIPVDQKVNNKDSKKEVNDFLKIIESFIS